MESTEPIQNRRHSVSAVFVYGQTVVLVALAAILAWHVSCDQPRMRVRELVLVDATDSARLVLSTDSISTSLRMLDQSGQERLAIVSDSISTRLTFSEDTTLISLALEYGYPSLRLLDSLGVVRASMRYNGLNSFMGIGAGYPLVGLECNSYLSRIYVCDPASYTQQATMAVANGQSDLDLYYSDGGLGLSARTVDAGSALFLYDSADTLRAGMTQINEGDVTGAQLFIASRNGKTGVFMGTGSTTSSDGTQTRYSENSIRIFDGSGYLTWQAPFSFGY